MKIIFSQWLLSAMLLLTIGANAQQKSQKRIDGIVAVVGKYEILESDIDKGFSELEASGRDVSKTTRCEMLGALMENKLFIHQAVQDSVVIEREILDAEYENQLNILIENKGSLDEVVKYYRKKSPDELKSDFIENINNNMLASRIQENIASKVDITPEEVRSFYNKIPKSELPKIGDEVELSEIIIKPEITKEQKQTVIDLLHNIRKEVQEGASFAGKVYVYSEDPGSIQDGGLYRIDKKTQFVKEFKDVAFSLKEGEISEPFETEFGYHIIYLEKIRGNSLDVRHILISPKPTEQEIEKARKKIEGIKEEIVSGKISFADAARKYSDNKDNKNSGGIMTNVRTGDSKYELNSITDRSLYLAILNLKEGELSNIQMINNQKGSQFQLLQVTKKIEAHVANIENDYIKIRSVALQNKQHEAVAKWIKDKMKDAYIYIVDEYKQCEFKAPWAQNSTEAWYK